MPISVGVKVPSSYVLKTAPEPNLMLVANAAPKIGVVNEGLVANATTVPLPVVEYDVPQADPVEFAIPAPG